MKDYSKKESEKNLKENLSKIEEEHAKAEYKRRVNSAKNAEEIWKIKKEETGGLLEIEKEYIAEKARIENERQKAEYAQKLAEAKTAAARQKIINKERREALKKEQNAYLDILKENLTRAQNMLLAAEEEAQNKKNAILAQIEELTAAKEKFSQNLSQGGFLQKVTKDFGGEEIQIESLKDWQSENKALKNYSKLLKSVTERLKQAFNGEEEAMAEIMAELRQNHKGEGGKLLAYLNAADEKELAEFVAGYKENRKLSKEIAEESYYGNLEELKEEFLKEWGELPQEFFNIGNKGAANFGEGFLKELKSIMEEAKTEIEEGFLQAGSARAVAMFFNGLKNKDANITNYSSVYNVQASSGESTQAQIAALRNAETYKRMQGGY